MEMKISINQTQNSMETLIDKLDHKEDRILWLEHTREKFEHSNMTKIKVNK